MMNLFALAALALALSPPAYALPLAPQHAGLFTDGDGANSRWVQVAPSWRGSIEGDEQWGTGIWGLADHAQVMELDKRDGQVMKTLDTVVTQINFGDEHYNDAWGPTWGTAELAPLFKGHGQGVGGQDNWASSFWGYIAIPTEGAYNFGVLFDDGFRFTLMGADGDRLEIHKDGLNPRDRLGFAEDLLLDPGLYAFQLDAYERLQVGVVQLSWWVPGANNWAVIPKENLFTRVVPEPATLLLMMAGFSAIGFIALRRRT